jgi:hypothetical protein
VLLGLLASCQQTEAPRAAAPAVSSALAEPPLEPAQTAARTSAYRSAEPATGLTLTGSTWARGSLTARALSIETPTRGGRDRLNGMADELRALAAQCGCTSQPLKLAAGDEVPGWQLLSVLGLLNVAGFSLVQVEHRGQSIRFELGPSVTPSPTLTLRILGSDLFLAGANAEATVDGMARLCGASACEGATLSVAAEAELDIWWRAAGIAAGANHARAVRVRLDSEPRPIARREPPGPAIQPIASIAIANIQKRVMAEYAALYACLVRFPLQIPAEPHAPLAFDLTIGADGVTQNVEVIGTAAPSEARACLRSAFQAMVFRAPNFAPAKVRYPFEAPAIAR